MDKRCGSGAVVVRGATGQRDAKRDMWFSVIVRAPHRQTAYRAQEECFGLPLIAVEAHCAGDSVMAELPQYSPVLVTVDTNVGGEGYLFSRNEPWM